MAKHFRIGGSTAKRTLNCPAWVNLAAKLPPTNRTNAAAERGTAMHEVLERMLLQDDFDTAVSRVKYPFDDYDLAQMRSAYTAVRLVFAQYGIEEYECEPLLSIANDVGGSPDVLGAGRNWSLIADFKFGRGEVDPTNNAQLLFYHWLATQDLKVRDLTLNRPLVGAIIQPALSAEPQIYEFSAEEVTEFDKNIRAAIEIVRSGNTQASAGSHCEWCPVEPYCTVRREEFMSLKLMTKDNAKALSDALTLLPQLEAYIKSVKDEANRTMIELGAEVPGFKLVAKKELRKFADPFKTAAALTSAGAHDIYSAPSLKTPAQLEKVLKTEGIEFDFTPWLKGPSGELEVAPVSDKRESVSVAPVTVTDVLKRNSAT